MKNKLQMMKPLQINQRYREIILILEACFHTVYKSIIVSFRN